MKPILIIEKLNIFNILSAIIASLIFEVHYLKLTGKINKTNVLFFLQSININKLNASEAHDSVVKRTTFKYPEYTDCIYQNIAKHPWDNPFCTELFPNISNIDKKLKISTSNYIESYLADTHTMLSWAIYYRDIEKRKVYIFTPNLLHKNLNKESTYYFKNLFHPTLYILSLLTLIPNTSTAIAKKIIKNLNAKQRELRSKDHDQTSKHSFIKLNKKFNIAFFPHKGVQYGDVYIKDHYYSPNEESPFFMQKILHIETQKTSRSEEEKIKSFYIKNSIPFFFINQYTPTQKIKTALSFLMQMLRKPHCAFKNIMALPFLLYTFIKFSEYDRNLKKYPDLRIALIGYDWLFPKPLSMALESNNITTVCHEISYGQTCYPQFRFICDYYLISCDYFHNHIQTSDKFCIKKTIAVGDYRTDSLYEYSKNFNCSQIETLKLSKKIVLALDFHSNDDPASNYDLYITNWKANKQFYTDLICLAAKNKDIHIIIRGKNTDWRHIPFYSDTVQIIDSMTNIEISTDYTEPNTQYKIASYADFVIARKTSMCDELMQANIPTLTVDYLPCGSGLFREELFDYEGLPVFVNNYAEMSSRVRQLINGTDELQNAATKPERSRLFGSFYDGQVKTRIGQFLTNLYSEIQNENTY